MYPIENIHKTEELINKMDKLQKTLDKSLDKTNQPERLWIDKHEAMNILRCSERTLQTLRDNDTLGYSKPTGGSKFFYRRGDVMALFEKSFTLGT